MFRVDPKTVTRWASAGRIGSIRTPGGHRRFRASEIQALLANLTVDSSLPTDRQPPEGRCRADAPRNLRLSGTGQKGTPLTRSRALAAMGRAR